VAGARVRPRPLRFRQRDCRSSLTPVAKRLR
jgi:hypothetical protein